MKKFLIGLAVFLVIAAGLIYLLYPTGAHQAAVLQEDRTVRNYHETVRSLSGEQTAGMLEEADAYNRELEGIRLEDIFSSREVPVSHRYASLLNTGDSVTGILTIPGIQLTLPVYHESPERKPTDCLVHLQGSSLPSEQPGTHTVVAGPGIRSAGGLAGKLGLTGARMLEDLNRLTPGDLMILNVLDRTLVYQVEWVQTMAPDGLAKLEMTPGAEENLLTLVAEQKERRLVVRGSLIPLKDAAEILKDADLAKPLADWQSILLLGSPVMLLGLIILTVIGRIRKRYYRLPVEWNDIGREATDTDTEEEEDHEA